MYCTVHCTVLYSALRYKPENGKQTSYAMVRFLSYTIQALSLISIIFNQRAKKVVSDSPGLVDFAIGLVNSVFILPDGQVMVFEEFK